MQLLRPKGRGPSAAIPPRLHPRLPSPASSSARRTSRWRLQANAARRRDKTRAGARDALLEARVGGVEAGFGTAAWGDPPVLKGASLGACSSGALLLMRFQLLRRPSLSPRRVPRSGALHTPRAAGVATATRRREQSAALREKGGKAEVRKRASHIPDRLRPKRVASSAPKPPGSGGLSTPPSRTSRTHLPVLRSEARPHLRAARCWRRATRGSGRGLCAQERWVAHVASRDAPWSGCGFS
eukprot:354615-Chlamydomonas_euryale.AAC.3